MTQSGRAFLLVSGLCLGAARGAEATAPVDYTQRNTPYAPGAAAAVPAEKKTPVVNEPLQEKRVDKTTLDKRPAAVGDKRAAIDIQEAREKTVREKDSHRPEKIEQPTSALNHRPAAISTSGDLTKPPTVTKYQDGLTAASATNMARFPAIDKATSAKINRFVFRKNPADPALAKEAGVVTPAAGGAAIQK